MPDHKRPAPAAAPIHDLISHRWSPRPHSTSEARREGKAARACSRQRVGLRRPTMPSRGISSSLQKTIPKITPKVLSTFVEFNQSWAKNAPVVAISVAWHKMPHDGSQNRHAFHDVGQASANLSLEATSLGLQVHQMAGIDPEKAREVFGIPEHFEAVAGIALGYPGDPMSLPEGRMRDGETGARQRKEASSFVYTGKWGHTSPIVK